MKNLWILLFQQTTEWKWKKAKNRQILRSCQRVEKAEAHESSCDNNCCQHAGIGLQGLWKKTGGTGDKRKNWDHTYHSIDVWLEYFETSKRPEGDCCHSDSSERPQLR